MTKHTRYNCSDRGRARRVSYRERWPEKIAARAAVRSALRAGTIKKKRCGCRGYYENGRAKCRAPLATVEAHHVSYNKNRWLDVKWLCPNGHKMEHQKRAAMA